MATNQHVVYFQTPTAPAVVANRSFFFNIVSVVTSTNIHKTLIFMSFFSPFLSHSKFGMYNMRHTQLLICTWRLCTFESFYLNRSDNFPFLCAFRKYAYMWMYLCFFFFRSRLFFSLWLLFRIENMEMCARKEIALHVCAQKQRHKNTEIHTQKRIEMFTSISIYIYIVLLVFFCILSFQFVNGTVYMYAKAYLYIGQN